MYLNNFRYKGWFLLVRSLMIFSTVTGRNAIQNRCDEKDNSAKKIRCPCANDFRVIKPRTRKAQDGTQNKKKKWKDTLTMVDHFFESMIVQVEWYWLCLYESGPHMSNTWLQRNQFHHNFDVSYYYSSDKGIFFSFLIIHRM